MHRGGARCVAFIQGLRIRFIPAATTAAAATAQALTICCKVMRRCVPLCMDTAVVRRVRRSLRVPCCHGEPSARAIVTSLHALVFVVVGVLLPRAQRWGRREPRRSPQLQERLCPTRQHPHQHQR